MIDKQYTSLGVTPLYQFYLAQVGRIKSVHLSYNNKSEHLEKEPTQLRTANNVYVSLLASFVLFKMSFCHDTYSRGVIAHFKK